MGAIMRNISCSRRRLRIALGTHSALIAAALMVSPAGAQTASDGALPEPDTAEESNSEQVITVTGSRIARSGFTSPTPTTVVGVEQIANAGVTNVGQLAQQIPAFQASVTPQTSTLSSQNAGAAMLNLRNLGTNRTLVLVNGRRFVPTTTSATVDTNVIPSAIIERVEVVTGGASAAYGSDAVAGVVNLILNRNLEGITGDAQAGISTYGDNETYKASLAAGTSFAGGRGHVTLSAEGEINKGIAEARDRPWANEAYGLISNPVAGQLPRRFILPGYQLATATVGGLINSGPLRGTDFGKDGVPRAFQYGQLVSGNFQIGGSGIEGSDLIPLTVPFERYSLYSTGEYDFGGVKAFVEGSYSYSRGHGALTPAFHLNNITIQPTNGFLVQNYPALAAQVTAPFSFGRFSPDLMIGVDNQNRTHRVVAGLEGGLGGNWKWSAYGEYGHTDYKALSTNNVITARFARSVDAVLSGGNIVCRVNANASTADDDPACVPVNLFGAGSPSQAAKAYFQGTQRYDVDIDQRVVAGEIQGDLFSIGDRAVTVASGAEYRENKVDGVSDPIAQAGGYLLGNPRALSGKIEVKEAFAEILVPLLADQPMFDSLELNGAVRVTDYSTSGTVVTWKGGTVWQVNDTIRLRATRSRDIRAPNFDELFTNALFRFTNVSDPQMGGAIRTVNIITQGNRNLQPEIADTLTGGIVLTPSFVPRLRASVDFFDIKIKGAIGTLGAQDIVTRCAGGNATLCSFITRDPAQGNIITAVTSAQINLSEIATRGLDVELSYQFPVGSALVSLRGLATYVDRFSTDDGITKIDRIGTASGNGLPHWKANASITYEDGPFTAFLQDRFVGGGKYDVTWVEGVDINDNSISGRNYLDLGLRYAVLDTDDQRVELFFNIRNLLNQDPPHVPAQFQTPSQTAAALYDVIGRQFLAGARFRF